MGPSRASEPSLAPMSFCFTKQGGRASWETDELHPSICLLSLFMTKLHYCPSYNRSQSMSLMDYRMESSLWVLGGCSKHFYWQSNHFLIMLLFYFFVLVLQQDRRGCGHTHTRYDCKSLGCTKTSGQIESKVRWLCVHCHCFITHCNKVRHSNLHTEIVNGEWTAHM